MKRIVCLTLLYLAFSCGDKKGTEKGTFGYDLNFLKRYKEVVLLEDDKERSKIAIVPDYQARVMTSTSNGMLGRSYGWINYGLIASGELKDHINVFGGENRFWIGPEGGQYSIFFKSGKPFEAKYWYTPKPIDTEKFDLVTSSKTKASFTKNMSFVNYSNCTFDVQVNREIHLLNREAIEESLNIQLHQKASFVAYGTQDEMINIGKSQWKKETGLLSIWIMGMFLPSDKTSIIVPYKDSLELNTSYFGEIDEDRLKVTDRNIFFKADGKYRCKIGVPPQNTIPLAGSYDPINKVLTVIKYSFDADRDCYVNSLWEIQDEPYSGDVFNAYNDGPMKDGTILGPFYELESSSYAAELSPNQSIKHKHITYHFQGDIEILEYIAKQVLNTSLEAIPMK